jgi:hypothetical protein
MNRACDTATTGSLDCAPRTSPLRVAAALLMLAAGVSVLAFAMSGSEAANRDYTRKRPDPGERRTRRRGSEGAEGSCRGGAVTQWSSP